MDNIFELIPFILIILWSIFGASGAKKKQQEARRRAEEQRQAREAQQRARMEPRESGQLFGAGETAEARGPARPADESAAGMVPDELWQILTGGAPPPTWTPGPARTPPEAEPDFEPEYEAEYESAEPGGWVTSPPWDEAAAVDSIEGVSAETGGRDVVNYDAAADATARARYEDTRAWSWDQGPARVIEPDERSDRRHVAFHTRLAEREIGAALEAARGPDLRSRLGLGEIGAVRRAIVLAEVLGPPKSLQ